MNQQRFPLGRIIATPAALQAIEESGQTHDSFLDRHVGGDWGTVCRQALGGRTRLLSAYQTLRGRWLWIITEADRSATTIFVPTECSRQILFPISLGSRSRTGLLPAMRY